MRRLLQHTVPAALVLLFAMWGILPVTAQILWTADGLPVADSAGREENPSLISDGSGGAIIAWANQISGESYDIYTQHINAAGGRMWTTEGVVVCAAMYDQYFPALASDGSGGAIIAWQDVRSETAESDIYAQRVDANGVVKWQQDGVPVCTETGNQSSATLASDGQGGAYIAWRDTRNDLLLGTTDIYLQHIGHDGQPLWAADLPIATSVGEDDGDVTAISDGRGGVILVWQDGRGITAVPPTSNDIYAQRVDASGTLLWGASGLAVCMAANAQRFPEVAPDGSGGALICWDDLRSGTDYDVYAQHVTADGSVAWTADGVPVCLLSGSNQVVPTLAADDDAGGAYIAWTDARNGNASQYYDIYAQRITSDGTPAWTANGIAVCAEAGWQGRIKSATDGEGNVLLAWSDNRVDVTNTTYYYDVYTQKLNPAGEAAWTANGTPACSASGRQDLHKVIPSGPGNAIVVWQDGRADIRKDIYAQKIGTNGQTPLPVPTPGAAKEQCDGTIVDMDGKVVTAVFGDSFYIQESDRSSGIRVIGTGVSEGESISVTGELDTLNGERVIINPTISNQTSVGLPRPLFLSNRCIGGTAFGTYTPGVIGGTGLNNVGLLISTSGWVTASGTGFVYMDDGSALNDGSGNIGVKVDTSLLSANPTGYVMVTGISSTEETPAGIIRVLRPRRDADVLSF